MAKRKKNTKNLPLEIIGFLVFSVGLFVLLSLLSFSPMDPSPLNNSTGAAQNLCGWVGAWTAAVLLQALGLGAFLVPAFHLFISATLYRGDSITRLVGIFAGMSVAVMAFTVFLTLQFDRLPYAGTQMLTGGVFGSWMASLLMGPFNGVGGSLVALVVFGIALLLSTPVSFTTFIGQNLRKGGELCKRSLLLAGGALFYLGSLALMRVSHALGDLIQRFMEATMERARERAEALRNLPREEVEVESEVQALPEPEPEPESESESEPEYLLDGEEVEEEEYEEESEDEDEEEWDDEEEGEEDLIQVSDLGQEPTIEPLELEEAPKAKTKRKLKRGVWKLPLLDFLRNTPKKETAAIDKDRLIQNSQTLKSTFAEFGIQGEVTAVRPGPVITLYEFKPAPGVKVSKIAALSDDLSMALSARSVRILAPLPGKSVVGIEIPSEKREKVFLRELLEHPDYQGNRFGIPMLMGKDIAGRPVISDLEKMPHLLIAGQTGSGKSVFMNGLIISILYRFTPDELRMVLVDPKFIEFSAYEDIPHLLLPVVDDPKQASNALKWAVREMERRYRVLALMGVRNLRSYNEKVAEMGEEVVADILTSEENQSGRISQMSGSDYMEAFEKDEEGEPVIGKLPTIVIIIDELADLMMVAKKDVEISIARVAQKARAAGIHLIIATQRPSTDVITGLIKSNLPSRASFSLASFVDSKTILDRAGAERLLGQGDMLFIPPGTSQLSRLHGAFVDDEEINKITSFIRSQGKPTYRGEILADEEEGVPELDQPGEGDQLFEDAVDLVRRSGHASASYLQRHLKVGYNRAARLIETMEDQGMVGPADGARPREVLIR